MKGGLKLCDSPLLGWSSDHVVSDPTPLRSSKKIRRGKSVLRRQELLRASRSRTTEISPTASAAELRFAYVPRMGTIPKYAKDENQLPEPQVKPRSDVSLASLLWMQSSNVQIRKQLLWPPAPLLGKTLRIKKGLKVVGTNIYKAMAN